MRLELRRVSVVRAGAKVLEKVNLTLARGEIVAVVGPNGAGKSTLIEAAIGGVPLAEGDVLIDGHPPGSLGERARAMGFLAAEAEPPAEARVAGLIDGKNRDPDWKHELETRLGLTALRSARVGALSRGERRRILMFEALASGKPFLLLDEPTGVFDPLQLVDVVALFRSAADRGTGLFITVHQMSDAEALGSRVVILNRGQIVADGPLASLCEQAGLPPATSLREVFIALLRRRRPEESNVS